MMRIIKKIQLAAKNRTTYKTGLLQAKAYRILKHHTSKALEKHGMASIHWAFLGLIFESKGGIRSSDAAEELGVEAPFITKLFTDLHKKGLVRMNVDPTDSRARLINLTDEGVRFVPIIESYLRAEIGPLIKDIPLNELISYLAVLQKIITNAKEIEQR